MAGTTRTAYLAAALAAAATGAAAPSAVAHPAELAVVLHVANFANVPARDLAAAEAEATRVYDDIGVRLVWTEQAMGPADEDGARHLAVLLLSDEMTERKIQERGIGNNVLGVALNVTRRAYIFRSRIAWFAAIKAQEGNTLLGRVIAHEVGHLLLPLDSDSTDGIMCGDLMARRARLRFNPVQGETIRARLITNTEQATTSTVSPSCPMSEGCGWRSPRRKPPAAPSRTPRSRMPSASSPSARPAEIARRWLITGFHHNLALVLDEVVEAGHATAVAPPRPTGVANRDLPR
jgi:hypothetical protein